jgi:hypothetical protein
VIAEGKKLWKGKMNQEAELLLKYRKLATNISVPKAEE